MGWLSSSLGIMIQEVLGSKPSKGLHITDWIIKLSKNFGYPHFSKKKKGNIIAKPLVFGNIIYRKITLKPEFLKVSPSTMAPQTPALFTCK